MGSCRICSFLVSTWEGNLNLNWHPAFSSWGPQDLCSYFTRKEWGFLVWPPLLQQQLHFWARWGGNVQLSSCPHLSKPLQALPWLPGGQTGSLWAPRVGFSRSCCSPSKCSYAGNVECSAAATKRWDTGFVLLFVGKDSNHHLLTSWRVVAHQRVCNRGQGQLCFTCWTCSAVWRSEMFGESQKVRMIPDKSGWGWRVMSAFSAKVCVRIFHKANIT